MGWLLHGEEFILARFISSGLVLSVRYSVMSGRKLLPGGSALIISSLYSTARAVVVTGGLRLGMMMALPKCLALSENTTTVPHSLRNIASSTRCALPKKLSIDDRSILWGSTASRTPPSRRWRCQSSGRVTISCSCCSDVEAMAAASRPQIWPWRSAQDDAARSRPAALACFPRFSTI